MCGRLCGVVRPMGEGVFAPQAAIAWGSSCAAGARGVFCGGAGIAVVEPAFGRRARPAGAKEMEIKRSYIPGAIPGEEQDEGEVARSRRCVRVVFRGDRVCVAVAKRRDAECAWGLCKAREYSWSILEAMTTCWTSEVPS